MRIYGLKNHRGNYELCVIGGSNFSFELEGEETDLPITIDKASNFPQVGDIVAVNNLQYNCCITKIKNMKIQYLPGTTEGQILLCTAQIGAIQRMLQSEAGIFSLKDIQVLLGKYQEYIANYEEICNALYEGVVVNLIP